jgi:hypothetical protein
MGRLSDALKGTWADKAYTLNQFIADLGTVASGSHVDIYYMHHGDVRYMHEDADMHVMLVGRCGTVMLVVRLSINITNTYNHY